MELHGRTVLITGAAAGLGAALARDAAQRGAGQLWLLDRDRAGLDAVRAELTRKCTVSTHLVDLSDLEATGQAAATTMRQGAPDLAIANAGVITHSGLDSDLTDWDRAWRIHVLSNVVLFRALLPALRRRGSGHLACTASTASLAPNPKSLVYTVTKHAQLALAEWTAAAVRGSGIGFTCFCPGGMRTTMLQRMADGSEYSQRAVDEADTPEAAASMFLDGVERGRTLVLTKERSQMALLQRAQNHDAFVANSAELFPHDP